MRIAEFRRAVAGAPWRQLIFAELVTDDGLTGVGEVRMVNKTRTLLACVEELAPRYMLGTDPFGAASSELPPAERRRSVAIVAAVRDAVRRATRIPIAMGERLHVLAGFRAMKRLAGWADVYSALLAPHNVGGPVATAANLQFAATVPNYKVLEHFNDFADRWAADLVDGALAVDPADGCFALPTGPGLGVRLDREACLPHPPTGARLELFREGWETRHQEGG